MNNMHRASQTSFFTPFSPRSNYVLDISEGIHDLGAVRWQLALCLLGAWILVCLCLIKGIKSQGKVSAR